ncbi:MAG: peptidoglycan editing factor PgeF [Chlamydiae bacterium]|nr:peptidoglycan editing factor PgeF [Chlamydiota bacterium]
MEFEKRKLEWLEFELLEDYFHLFDGSFMRHGGVSEGRFASLNLSASVGDHPDNVKVNKELVRETVGVSKLIFANQVHGNNIVEVVKGLDHIPNADGLFTQEKDVGLVITHADCQAAIFYNPEIEAIAALHVGWKGLVQNLYKKCVDLFISKGSKLHDIIVCVSPSLGKCHAEFVNYKKELPEDFWSYKDEKDHFDLKAIAKKQLMDAGVYEGNIEISDVCTYAAKDDFFSHRRDKETGRNATVIAINSR